MKGVEVVYINLSRLTSTLSVNRLLDVVKFLSEKSSSIAKLEAFPISMLGEYAGTSAEDTDGDVFIIVDGVAVTMTAEAYVELIVANVDEFGSVNLLKNQVRVC